MHMKTVLLKGGLGNQLFQWAFAHVLAAQGFQVRLLAFEQQQKLRTGYFEETYTSNLKDLTKYCSCLEIESVDLNPRFYRSIRDPEATKNPFRIFPNYVKNFDQIEIEYSAIKKYLKYRNFSGYFQNVTLVSSVEKVLNSELQKFLENCTERNLSFTRIGSKVMHIRRGDFGILKHFADIGVLSSDYYFRSTQEFGNAGWTVITDDPNNIQDITSHIKVNEVCGPAELNTVSALIGMASAKELIISNSTLSWWGGFLAANRGARVVGPSLWHRTGGLSKPNVLTYSKFQSFESKFFTDIDEYNGIRALKGIV